MNARGARARAAASPAPPTREAILDAAERLFSAHGVDGVAVRDIARELGLTPSSLYNHFPGKQALYEAVLERGLHPILETVDVAWRQEALSRQSVDATVDALLTHLAKHPHLGPLLQRALLAEAGNVPALIARWLSPLYQQGVAVVGNAAAAADWKPAEVPHLAVGLFGLVFSYFVNAEAMKRLSTWGQDVGTPASLAVQRRFLEKAIFRLLGPRRRDGAKPARRARRTHG